MPGLVLFEDDDIITLMSLENHPLVIPKNHIKDIYTLDVGTGEKIIEQLVRTSNAIKKGLQCDGVYITQANEAAAGQHVFHIHFHVRPRWLGQPMDLTKEAGMDERKITLEKIKAAF